MSKYSPNSRFQVRHTNFNHSKMNQIKKIEILIKMVHHFQTIKASLMINNRSLVKVIQRQHQTTHYLKSCSITNTKDQGQLIYKISVSNINRWWFDKILVEDVKQLLISNSRIRPMM